ncbi:MAG: sulfite exporter TauE/SafE family protein [Alphaproteobacteria bacterium]
MDLIPEISLLDGALVIVVSFIAGVMRGFSGFGSALAIVPVVAYVFGPQLAVPAVVAIHLASSIQLVPSVLRDVDWGRTGPLSVAGCLAVPVGAWVLVTQDPELLRKTISVLIVFFALMMMRGWRYQGKVNGWVMAVVGVIDGVITGAATIGGPPVVTFLMAGPFRAAQNRASIILFFICIQSVACGMYWIAGLWVLPIVGICLLSMPPLMLGMWLGQHLFSKASEEGFRRVALLFLLAIGLATLFL